MIDPSKELFKWGPIDAKVIYVDAFMQGMTGYIGVHSAGWPDLFLHVKNDKVIAIADYSDLRKNGEKLFVNHVLDEKELDKNYNEWKNSVGSLLSLEKRISNASEMSDEKLKDLFKEWTDVYLGFWKNGFLPELSNWGGEQLLKKKLLEIDKDNFVMLFERLAAPEDLSFFQKEELDLLRIKLMDEKDRKIEEHRKSYFWIRNSYGHVEVAPVSFFQERLDSLTREKAEKLIGKIENFPEKTRMDKKQLADEYNLPKDISEIGEKLGFCIWWQDLRKKYIFIANHCTRILIEELNKRLEIPVEELEAYTFPEMLELLFENKRINYEERKKGFLEYLHEDESLEFFEGEKANKILEKYIQVKVDKEVKEVKGTVVSIGKAKGKARILLTPKEAEKVEKGDVLVAPMTSPDYIIAMRKASAIVTDEGGMTCHAAIVSRELGIPCIVATGIATKVLKDGDLVKVDAEKGIIMILEK